MAGRIRQAIFKFKPFSNKQLKVLSWWLPNSPVNEMDGIIADGAIRSGKTLSMSLSYVMWAMFTFNGQNFGVCGKTIGSFRRNVLFWLKLMLRSRGYGVSDHRADNLVVVTKNNVMNYFYIFGGKDERSQDLIQGITLAGCFFDEVALMPESFVNQATGRCSVDGSKFWFNCNPDGPYHWFKVNWIDKIDIKNLLYLHFTMNDNLSLSEKIKARYKSMYSGVFYDRYIRGLWVVAEGLIYQQFADNPNDYIIDDEWLEKHPIVYGTIGVDFGGTKSAHAFTFTGFTKGFKEVVTVKEYYKKKRISPATLEADFIDFVRQVQSKYKCYEAFMDSAEQTLITGMEAAVIKAGIAIDIKNAVKGPINDRIAFYNSMMAQGRYKIHKSCKHTREALESAVYDEKQKTKDVRLDDGQMNIDSLDAMEYTTEKIMNDIMYLAI